jgi:hypothetical protein
MFGRKTRARHALAAAQESLDQATAAHADQKRKRQDEEEALISRLDRLAADNHLAELVLAALTERHHPGRGSA